MDMRPDISRSARFALFDDQTARVRGPSASENVRRYDLKRALEQIRRRLLIIVASVALGGSLSVAVGFVLKPSYTATALLAVNEPEDDGSGRAGDVSVDTQIAMLQSPVFIERAFESLSHDGRLSASIPKVQDLERRLKVMQVMRSRLISVNFSAKSSSEAADIANMIARLYVEDPLLQSVESIDDASETLSRRIASLEDALQHVQSQGPNAQAGGLSTATGTVEASDLRDQIAALKLSQSLSRRRLESRQQTLALSPPVQLVALAKPPARASSVSRRLIVIPAILSSAIFGVALALVLGALDKRVYLPSDLIKNFAAPYAGAVPARRRSVITALTRVSANDVGYLRAIDAVVTETLLLCRAQRRAILITTSDDDNETLEFALSVASAAARMRRRVLLVDIDTTQPSQRFSKRGDSNQRPGVFDVLAGRCPLSVAIHNIPGADLDYLPNRHDSEADTLALIVSGRLNHLVAELAVNYDWVILRGPPVIGVSETRLIAAEVDATILIVRSGRSKFPEIENALDTLSSSMTMGSPVDASSRIVTILTDAPRQSLPATFRDKRAARRAVVPIRPAESGPLPMSECAPEPTSDRADRDGVVNRLVPSPGLQA